MTIQSSNNYYDSYLNIKNNNIQSNNSIETEKTNQSTPPKEAPLEDFPQVIDPKKVNQEPNQEAIALYYNYQANQLVKDVIDIYAKANEETDYSNESVEVSFSDISDLQKQINKGIVLEDIAATPKDERNDLDRDNLKEFIDNNKPELNLSKEEAVALYYNYQANQLTKDIINIYANNNESSEYSSTNPTVSLGDINELQKQLNKNEVLNNISET